MLDWLFRRSDDVVLREALTAMRGVVANQLEVIRKQAEEIGSLRATVGRQFDDLRALTAAAASAPAAVDLRPQGSPLLRMVETGDPSPKPKGTPQPSVPQPRSRRPFGNMHVSGGHTTMPAMTQPAKVEHPA